MKRLKKGRPVSDYQTVSLINSVLDTEETQLKVIIRATHCHRDTYWTCPFTSEMFHGPR